MLSGDKQVVLDKVAKELGIDNAYGDLLLEGKVEKVQALKNEGRIIAFVGDGVNDAPVVALADAGIAMGGLGSDATIETADIVIQNDQPSRIVTAIKIGKITRSIVWQNITIAMIVKAIVLILGAGRYCYLVGSRYRRRGCGPAGDFKRCQDTKNKIVT